MMHTTGWFLMNEAAVEKSYSEYAAGLIIALPQSQ
jgi:hypothetical protein